jgi:hypothetical protein
MPELMQPLSKYLAARRVEILNACPDASREEISDTLDLARDTWIREVQQYATGAEIPTGVYRSFRYHLGPQEAIRAFRYAGNFAALANLPSYLGDGE